MSPELTAGFLQIFVDPLSLRREVRQGLAHFFQKYLQRHMSVYDVGCGDKPFASFMKGRVREYVGVDVEDGFYDARHIDLIGDAYSVPVPTESVDAVISSQVLEHLERPLDALTEAHRILKPDGLLFLSAPFLYPLHAAPRDFGRFTRFYWNHHLAQCGFRIEDFQTIGGFWFCISLFTNAYLQTFNRGSIRRIRIMSFAMWLVKVFSLGLHKFEGLIIRLARRDPEAIRATWAINYVIVARRVPYAERVDEAN
jgi:SAM-dependent methyltransferase